MNFSHICPGAVVVVPDGLQNDHNYISRDTADDKSFSSCNDSSTELYTDDETSSQDDVNSHTNDFLYPFRETKLNQFDGFLDVPLCCIPLPVGNTSLLLRNCKQLYRVGVQTIFVVVHQRYTTAVQRHLECNEKKTCVKPIVVSVDSSSIIGALRDAREKELHTLQDDFYLLMADVFLLHGSTDLRHLRERHLKNLKTDSKRLLTRLCYECPNFSLESDFPYSCESVERAFFWNYPFPDRILVIKSLSDQLLAMSLDSPKQKSCLQLPLSILDHETDPLRILSRVVFSEVEFVSIHLFTVLEELFDMTRLQNDLVNCVLRDELQLHSIGVIMLKSSPAVCYPMGFRVTNPSLLLLMQTILYFSRSSSSQTKYSVPSKITDQNVSITNSFIGRDVHLGSDTVIEHCIIFDNVWLNDRGHYRYCIIFPKCKLPPDVSLSHTVVQGSTHEVDEFVELYAAMNDELKIQDSFKGKSSLSHIWLTHDAGRLDTLKSCDIAMDLSVSLPKKTPPLMSLESFFRPVKELNGALTSCSSSSDSVSEEPEDHDEDPLSTDQGVTGDISFSLNTSGDPSFFDEIYLLALEALYQPLLREHKLLEMNAFRLASHQRHGSCLEPCARALIDFFSLEYHDKKSFSVEMMETCQGDDLIAFLVEDSTELSFRFLSALLDTVSTRHEISIATVPQKAEGNGISSLTGSKTVSNAFRDPKFFCSLLSCIRELDLISDSVLISWCLSVPSTSQYFVHLQSFAKALQEHIRSHGESTSD